MKAWGLVMLLLAGKAAAEPSAASAGEQRCLDAFRAETARIERDLARRVPAKNDTAAQQALAADLHRALHQAGDRAEACSRAARAPFAAAAASAAEACATRARQGIEAVERRYAGRTLNAAEQTAHRNEQMRVLDERNTCVRPGVRR